MKRLRVPPLAEELRVSYMYVTHFAVSIVVFVTVNVSWLSLDKDLISFLKSAKRGNDTYYYSAVLAKHQIWNRLMKQLLVWGYAVVLKTSVFDHSDEHISNLGQRHC